MLSLNKEMFHQLLLCIDAISQEADLWKFCDAVDIDYDEMTVQFKWKGYTRRAIGVDRGRIQHYVWCVDCGAKWSPISNTDTDLCVECEEKHYQAELETQESMRYSI